MKITAIHPLGRLLDATGSYTSPQEGVPLFKASRGDDGKSWDERSWTVFVDDGIASVSLMMESASLAEATTVAHALTVYMTQQGWELVNITPIRAANKQKLATYHLMASFRLARRG